MTLVREFHVRAGGAAPDVPPLRPDPAVVRLRARLIHDLACYGAYVLVPLAVRSFAI